MIHYDPTIKRPWWAAGSWQALEALIKCMGEPVVFEWGGGASTLWLAERCTSVVTVEHSPEWLTRISKWIKEKEVTNVELATPVSYAGALAEEIADGMSFDIVIIDGVDRQACLQEALRHRTEGQLLVIDDMCDHDAETLPKVYQDLQKFDEPHPHHSRYPKRTGIFTL